MQNIVLNEKNVKLNVTANTWEEAVRIAGDILVHNGIVEPTYVDGIIRSIKEYGPYIIISKGFAIPHTCAQDGAKKVGFSLITLKHPVYFDGDKEAVHMMICFAATDPTTHLDILKMIVEFVDKGYVEKISKMKSLHELNALLQDTSLAKDCITKQ